MRNFWLNIPRSVSAVRALELSKEAKHRLCIIGWYEDHERNAALTCQRFGISRDTFYRWLRRFQRYGPGGLENGSHRSSGRLLAMVAAPHAGLGWRNRPRFHEAKHHYQRAIRQVVPINGDA